MDNLTQESRSAENITEKVVSTNGDGGPNEHLARLVRTFSEKHHSSDPPSLNPNFTFEFDTRLNPNSPDFDAKHWLRAFIRTSSDASGHHSRLAAGLSYCNLSVYGTNRPLDYQPDVLNFVCRGIDMIKEKMKRDQSKILILDRFDGLIKSGEMLLVLGRPGSGVSTLLKTIAGETHGLHINEKSVFNYQGISWEAMRRNFRGEIVYQAETDVHFPQLTVGQTLSFAAMARTPRTRFGKMSRKQYASQLRDIFMAMFGLSHTVNTKLGNDFIRGVSGGERKRVSIAEVALTQSPIQCWDNSTRGLDSATALDFIRTVQDSARVAGTTAIVAMYQASQLAYESFDKVALLYEGRQIYFGNIHNAKAYFVELGYHCPARQPAADFLTSLTSPEERQIRSGFENRVPKTPDDFRACWERSEEKKTLLRDIELFNKDFPIGPERLNDFKASRKVQQSAMLSVNSPYTISVPLQIALCIARGFERLRSDVWFFMITVFGNLAISLILGSAFYDLPSTAESLSARSTLLFFTVLFNALSSSLEIFSLYSQRPIVEKHARYALYHPFAEAISSIICELPSKILSTFFFNVPLYFMSNLRKDASAFFIFLLFGFTCTLVMSMIFRTVGQTSRDIHQALTPVALIIIALVIYAGYIIPIRTAKHWLRWINYLDPFNYALESILANEFHHRKFPCTVFVPEGTGYQGISETQRTCSVPGAAPDTGFVDGDVYIKANFEYTHDHIWRNFGILLAYVIIFTATYLLAAEFIVMGKSKGEVLLFRRGHRPISNGGRPEDEESQQPMEMKSSNAEEADTSRANLGDSFMKVTKGDSVFHWRHVSYNISIKGGTRKILDDVDGWVKPGTLTALMGATGAGKTTLLDVLAKRVTVGLVRGDISVNGVARGEQFQRQTGYVHQQDLHLETSTVREALQFSAMLRQPFSVAIENKLKFVEETIDLLEMRSYAEAVIGVPGEGLNVEQRKRLSIGVEIAAKPELLLFLDEPTSGLDSQTAWSIIKLIRKLSDNGQAILTTIHQPSALLFQQFDRLLLLGKGGRTVYFGEIGINSHTVTQYFQRYGAIPCNEDENPAEWVMSTIRTGPASYSNSDWPTVWQQSPEYQLVQNELSLLSQQIPAQNNSHEADHSLMKKYATPFLYQLQRCIHRTFQQYWRTPSYIYSKLALCFGTALFIGLSFQDASLTVQGLHDQMFSIFMLMIIFAFLLYQAMPAFVKQRELFEARERSAKAYSWIVFMISNIVAELPWNSLAALLIFVPFYYLVGMNQNTESTHSARERGGLMFLLIWNFMLYETTFAVMVIAAVKTAEIGAIIGLLLFAFSLIFCGVLVTPDKLPRFWIFMYRVSPFTYLVSALLSTGLANAAVDCSAIETLTIQPPNLQTCGEYLKQYIQIAGGQLKNPLARADCQFCPLSTTNTFLNTVYSSYNDRWRNYGILWVYIFFNIGAALALYWLIRVPKKD